MRFLLALCLRIAWVSSFVTASPAAALIVATYTAELSERGPGQLLKALLDDKLEGFSRLESVVDRVAPDILLVTDIDTDDYTKDEIATALGYPYAYFGAMNRGRESGIDLNRNGYFDGEDRVGFGYFYGQHGMMVFSRYPLASSMDLNDVTLGDLNNTSIPMHNGDALYDETAWLDLPVSATGHWVMHFETDIGEVALLMAYATVPVFDDGGDRNDIRNAAEIDLWLHYLNGHVSGHPPPEIPVIVMGNYNLDPEYGEGFHDKIHELTNHPRLRDPAPTGAYGKATAYWPYLDLPPLRVDYILPDRALTITDSGITWPRDATGNHAMVWISIQEIAGQEIAGAPSF